MKSFGTPANPYFLVRVEKQQEQDKRTKMGFLDLHPSYVYMDRNTQNCEVIGISEGAHKCFKEVEIGDTLLVHHFLQSSAGEDNSDHLVDTDENYNYYVASAKDHNGKRNEVYAVYKNGQIITHPEYLLLEMDIAEKEIAPCENSFIELVEWTETKEEKSNKMQRLQKEIQALAGKTNMTDFLKRGIEEKEAELAQLSKELNKRQYLPYQIAAFHPILSQYSNTSVNVNDIIFCLESAVNTTIEFQGKNYRTCHINYISIINK